MQLVTTKYLTQRSNVADARATTCFFYIPTILTRKRYENLAASTGSIMKPLTSSILMMCNSSKGSTFLECFKNPVPLAVGRLYTITFGVKKKKSLNEPVRQVRKLSEGFEKKHSNYMPKTLIN